MNSQAILYPPGANDECHGCDAIVSNPPFTHKAQIFERVLSFNLPFALLMRWEN